MFQDGYESAIDLYKSEASDYDEGHSIEDYPDLDPDPALIEEQESIEIEPDSTQRQRSRDIVVSFQENRAKRELLKDERITFPTISKYELAMVIGLRAKQILMNSPIYLPEEELNTIRLWLPETGDFKWDCNAMQIAEMEFVKGTLPFTVRRIHTDGDYEDWGIHEFENRYEIVGLRQENDFEPEE